MTKTIDLCNGSSFPVCNILKRSRNNNNKTSIRTPNISHSRTQPFCSFIFLFPVGDETTKTLDLANGSTFPVRYILKRSETTTTKLYLNTTTAHSFTQPLLLLYSVGDQMTKTIDSFNGLSFPVRYILKRSRNNNNKTLFEYNHRPFVHATPSASIFSWRSNDKNDRFVQRLVLPCPLYPQALQKQQQQNFI